MLCRVVLEGDPLDHVFIDLFAGSPQQFGEAAESMGDLLGR